MKVIRKITLSFFIGAVCVVVWFGYSLPPKSEVLDKKVHVSIDDCVKCLKQLAGGNVESIFDVDFFKQLRDWHERYGVRFTLYVYSHTDDFCIESVPNRFRSEFMEAAEYLKFGFHATSNDFKESMAQDGNAFTNSILHVNNVIDRFAGRGSRARILRLDRFYAQPDWRPALLLDTEYILAPDDERVAYWLSAADSLLIREKGALPFEIPSNVTRRYWRTDDRYENMFWVWYELETLRDEERIVIFTHEWSMDDRVKAKMEESFRWFSANGYHYVN